MRTYCDAWGGAKHTLLIAWDWKSWCTHYTFGQWFQYLRIFCTCPHKSKNISKFSHIFSNETISLHLPEQCTFPHSYTLKATHLQAFCAIHMLEAFVISSDCSSFYHFCTFASFLLCLYICKRGVISTHLQAICNFCTFENVLYFCKLFFFFFFASFFFSTL